MNRDAGADLARQRITAYNPDRHACRYPRDQTHIHHWAQRGETKLGDLISLCRFHHRLVHEGGVRIEVHAEGRWRLRLPDGATLDSAPVLAKPAASEPPFADVARPQHTGSRRCGIVAANAAQSIRITPQTAVTRWRGEPMDDGLALDMLCQQAGMM